MNEPFHSVGLVVAAGGEEGQVAGTSAGTAPVGSGHITQRQG